MNCFEEEAIPNERELGLHDADSGLWLKLRVSFTEKDFQGDKLQSILLPALMCINSYMLN